MGQKVNPTSFRLGAKPRRETVRQAEQLSPVQSRGERKERNNQVYSYDSSNTKESGKNLNLMKMIEHMVQERRSLQKYVRGRLLVLQKGRDRRISIAIFHPLPERTDEGQKEGYISSEEKKEKRENVESLSFEDMKTSREVDRQVIISGSSDFKVNLNRVSLTDIVLKNSETKIEVESIKEKMGPAKLKPIRVNQEGLISAVILNCRGPYPKLLATILAIRREDARKQSDVLTEVEKVMELVDESKLGLVTYDQRKSGEKKNVPGGYRGYRFVVKGTIDGSRRTRKHIIQSGTMPFSSISQVITNADTVAKTKIGTRGVHVNYHY